jgi:predicted nucleic acid-binding protein
MAGAVYLADTSVYVLAGRHKEVRERFAALYAQRWMDVTAAAMDRALAVHPELAAKSQHRRFRLPDLIIAATAEEHGATVLHYDADYDRIAEVTGQPVEWVAAKGSL